MRRAKPGGAWELKISGGTVVLATAAPADRDQLVLNRILVKLRIDPTARRIDIEQGEIGNADLGVALSGSLDFSCGDPRLALGVAGTRMSVAAMKSIWPFFVAPKVRAWVEEHVGGGTVERLMIATNAPMSTLKAVRPADPRRRAGDRDRRPRRRNPAGRTACRRSAMPTSTCASPGAPRPSMSAAATWKSRPAASSSITNGVFEVPDTFPKAPPAKARFRLDGSVPAAAELLSLERLRDHSGLPLDPATSRGTLTAQVTLGMPLKADLAPGSSIYTVAMDVTQLRRRTPRDGPEGRGRRAQGQRQQPGLLDPRRREDQRHPGQSRLPQAARQRRRRSPRCRPRSTRRRAASSASIWPACSAARCRSRSTAACRRTTATAAIRSRPI